MTTKRKFTHVVAAAGIGLLIASHAANATVTFNANVTPDVIFGSGNANGSFTVDRENGVEVGLRGKLRHGPGGGPENTFNSNGDGTYSFVAGVAPTQAFPTAVWSFEWSINSDYDLSTGNHLDDLTYALGIDSDPSLGTSFSVFDPINDGNPGLGGALTWDHSTGTNATGNGGGSEVDTSAGNPDRLTDYATAIATNTVAQNSWKAHWFLSGFDPTVDGQYDFYLAAFAGSTQIARTDISIIVGNGASVPEPSTLAILALGLAGLGFGKRKAT